MESGYWKKCSTCKKPIGFNQIYQACSVSTCNHQRTGLAFCSVSCWSAHVPILRHRESWAIEKTSPSEAEAPAPARIIVPSRASAPSESESTISNDDILVVASKMKAYIKDKSGGMNTSAEVMDTLSQKLRKLADEAIVRARNDGRKTVMARDF